MLGLTHHWKIGLNYDDDKRMSHWGLIHLKESCVPLTLYSWCVYIVSLRPIHCYAKLNLKQKIDLRLGNERSPLSLCANQTQFLFLPLCHTSCPLELGDVVENLPLQNGTTLQECDMSQLFTNQMSAGRGAFWDDGHLHLNVIKM